MAALSHSTRTLKRGAAQTKERAHATITAAALRRDLTCPLHKMSKIASLNIDAALKGPGVFPTIHYWKVGGWVCCRCDRWWCRRKRTCSGNSSGVSGSSSCWWWCKKGQWRRRRTTRRRRRRRRRKRRRRRRRRRESQANPGNTTPVCLSITVCDRDLRNTLSSIHQAPLSTGNSRCPTGFVLSEGSCLSV